MNQFCEINGRSHYNFTKPRVQQGKTRAKKNGYRPRQIRANHHVGAPKPKKEND